MPRVDIDFQRLFRLVGRHGLLEVGALYFLAHMEGATGLNLILSESRSVQKTVSVKSFEFSDSLLKLTFFPLTLDFG
jgi:hypothetical protein